MITTGCSNGNTLNGGRVESGRGRGVQHNDIGSNMFCLTTHAGYDKIFSQTTVIRMYRFGLKNVKLLLVEFSLWAIAGNRPLIVS